MIFINSVLKISDNSGARTVKCIRVYKKKQGYIGDLILVSIKTYNPKKKIKKGELYKAIIIRMKVNLRENTSIIRYNDNAAVLLNKKLMPIGSRIFGSTSKKLRISNKKLFMMITHSF